MTKRLVDIDDELLERARAELGCDTIKDTVNRALAALSQSRTERIDDFTSDCDTSLAMSIKSMTGFARTEGALGNARWHWEVRSVNGRGLDVRFRLPPGFDMLEIKCKEAAQKRLVRGNVTVCPLAMRSVTSLGVSLPMMAV